MVGKSQELIFKGGSMKQWLSKGYWAVLALLLAAIVLGQVVSYLAAPASWQAFVPLLPKYLSMIAFWGPIVALVAGLLVWTLLKLLGFNSLAEIRKESVEENNPAPAIIFTGTIIASILFLMLILRP
jgi:predicted lysophospholipase L1 biosynthesis ABC-type transport system permease subunit